MARPCRTRSLPAAAVVLPTNACARLVRLRSRLALVTFSAILAACGGGGDSGPPPIPGTFDKAFAVEGLFELSASAFNGRASSARSVNIAPDGTLLVAGRGYPQTAVYARLQPGGEFDATFAGSGIVLRPAPMLSDYEGLWALAAANDKTIFVQYGSETIGGIGAGLFDYSRVTTSRVDANGVIDGSFASTDMGMDGAQALVEPEGTVLLLGPRPIGLVPLNRFRLERIGIDGGTDALFAQNAAAAADCFGAQELYIGSLAMARQPDGKIVVARQGFPAGAGMPSLPLCVFRINRDGTLDASFGAGGRTLVDESLVAGSGVVAVLPRRDGGNVVVLNFRRMQDDAVAVVIVWLAPDGTVDRAWGTSGLRIADNIVKAAAAAIDNQGRLVLAGFRGDDATAAWPFPWSRNDPVIVRVKTDGMGDDTFGTRGFGLASLTVAGKPLQPADIAIGPDGSIFVAGFVGLLSDAYSATGTNLALAKLHGGGG